MPAEAVEVGVKTAGCGRGGGVQSSRQSNEGYRTGGSRLNRDGMLGISSCIKMGSQKTLEIRVDRGPGAPGARGAKKWNPLRGCGALR
jgi:hypothetical protein